MVKHGFDQVNTDISEIENEISDTPPEKEKPRRSGGAISFLSLVFALSALVGTGWMWWQDQQVQDETTGKVFTEIARLESSDTELSLKLRQLRDEIESLPSGDHSAEITALHQRLESGANDVDRLGQTINDQLALSRSLQKALEAMQGRLLAAESALAGVASQKLDAGGELDLAEVDYLLRLANERLKLFSDSAAADQVLEMADLHLAAMDNPMYLGVRQGIAVARRDLAEVTLPDYFAISNELDAIQQSIISLQFKGESAVAQEPEAPVDDGWWQKFKSVFSGLVTVRRSTDEENDRISLEDKDYIRQRLWLQLEIAHLSLMRRDQKSFRNSLDRVQKTLAEWFDDDSASYQTVKSRLDELASQQIQVEAPDISGPWATLRLIRAGRGQPGVPTPPASPEQQLQPASEPATIEPATDKPAANEPITDESSTNEPAGDEPAPEHSVQGEEQG